jgi:MFS family permease
VPFQLLRNRVVAVAVTAGFLAGVAMFGVITFVPLFAQGTLGATAIEAGSLLTPLMLSWVLVAIVGGRLLLRIGYRPTSLLGFAVLTAGTILLALYDRGAPRWWLYFDLCVIGAGLGLTMLTLLIAVQQSVAREQLGIATSLNQFSRSIGGAVGVAVMGAVLSAGLASELGAAARAGAGGLSEARAAELAANPNALVEPAAQAALAPAALEVLRGALAASVGRVFWAGAVVSALALLVTFALPRRGARGAARAPTSETCDIEAGERLLVAELAALDTEHEPVRD